MRHRKKSVKLDRTSGVRRQLLRTLVVNMVLREHIRTTAAKAKAVQPLVERCITLGKTNTLTTRRQLLATLADPRATAKLLEVIGPRYQTRSGGYTRVVKLGHRAGDAAPEVLLELVP
ncbi:50S ribosomal protein L17 [Candidatus Uhrbacteria bacterium]|nr:50S ribosomal protein L17 [Candidatus Uhrbacteria bacterium]